MRPPSPSLFVRIVTPVQAEETTWQALELGAAMAKELRAELRALFLRDAEALAAAALPVTRTVSYQTGMVRSFDVALLESAYRAKAVRVRERVAQLCRTESLQWSFEMAEHFDTAAGPLAAAGNADEPSESPAQKSAQPPLPAVRDLLLLDPRSLAVRRQALPLLRLLTRHVLVGLWDRHAPKPDRVVLFSRGETDALASASAIAQRLDVELEIWVYGSDGAERATRSATVVHWLGDQRVQATLREVETGDSDSCRQLLRRHANALALFDSSEILKTAFEPLTRVGLGA